jgi:hypothetical protein
MNTTLSVVFSGLITVFFFSAPEFYQQNRTMSDTDSLIIDREKLEVRFTGKMYPSRFNSFFSFTKHHHFIVWKDGRAAFNALIRADVNDLSIQRALEELGAVAGNTLTAATWEKRDDPKNPEPDKQTEGTPIDVEVQWKNDTARHAEDIFNDDGKKGFAFRFGGHVSLIPVWRSGCVVCLQSCPGGRISNARYTMRDYAKDIATFSLKKNLPDDDTPVQITLRIVK